MSKCTQCGGDVDRATCPKCGAVRPAKTYSDGADFPWRLVVVAGVLIVIAAWGGYWFYGELARTEAAQKEYADENRRQAAASERMWHDARDIAELQELKGKATDAAAWRAEVTRRGWQMCPTCGWTGLVGNGESCVTCDGRGYRRPEQK